MPGDLDFLAGGSVVQEAKDRCLCVSSSHLFGHIASIATRWAVRADRQLGVIVAFMNGGDRIERAVFETDRQLIVGDVTLPQEGYQSRLSDSLNRPDLDFVPLTDVEITALDTGKVSERPLVVVAKAHIRVAFPL